jgi:tetratricopeptide (TPR) repeat protein
MKETAPLRLFAVPDFLRLAILGLTVLATASAGGQGQMVVAGRVWLPDGKPASAVRVLITGPTGISITTITDTSGQYQQQVPTGRYRVSAVNPQDREQFTDPVEAEGNRTNIRIVVHLFLRLPSTSASKEARANVVSVAEASQKVRKDARKSYESGVKQRSNKEFDKALASLERAIEIYPSYFQALAERGEVRINLGQISKAAEDFEAALALNPDYELALRGAGYCRLSEQKYAEAAQLLGRAVLTDSSVAESHLFLGVANLALGKNEAARTALKEALRLDPNKAVTAHIYLSNLSAQENKFKEAADELQAYLSARPNSPDAPRLKQREAELRGKVKGQ